MRTPVAYQREIRELSDYIGVCLYIYTYMYTYVW